MKIIFSSHTLFLLILLCLHTHFSVSQESKLPYVLSYYGTKQGLPQNQVISILPKRDGTLTISTTNGIVNYNGAEFYPFITDDEYKKDIYLKITWHPEKDILYGWELGGGYNKIYPEFVNLGQFSCVSFEDTLLTYVTKEGVVVESNYELTKTYHSLKTSIQSAKAVLNTPDFYYVSDWRQLYRVSKRTGESVLVLDGFFDILRLKLNPYTQDVYALSQDKAHIISTGGVHRIPLKVTSGKIILRDIEFINKSESFISYSDGLIHIKDTSLFYYHSYDGNPIPPLYSIYYQKTENCFLIGTEYNGLMKLTPKQASSYLHSYQKGSQSFVSVTSNNGEVFSSYTKGNIVRLNEDNELEEYLSLNAFIASLSFIGNKLYVGTWGSGLMVFENKRMIDSIVPPKLPSTHVYGVFSDSKRNTWFATEKGVVKRTISGKYEPIPGINSRIVSIYELRNGNMCFGGSEGVFIVTGNKIVRHLGAGDGLICKEARAFYEDERGALWIGTYNGGLYRYTGKEGLISVNNQPNCMLNQDVFTVVKGSNGLLYMSSNQGIWAVSEQKLNDFLNGTIPYLIPFFFGEEAGILNGEFNGGFQNNSLQISGNRIFFPSIQGVVELEVKDIVFRKLHPVLRAVFVNDTLHNSPDNTFKRATHTVRFDFNATSFLDQYNVLYQHKLEGKGMPSRWSTLQKEQSVTFKMLPPGKYRLTVRAIDGFNDLSPEEISYEFTIQPHFYETAVFWIVLIAAGLLASFILVRSRMQRLRREERKESRINHTITEMKIKTIQSRMNPHFIFNSLNNIIYLLNVEKYEEAEQLLNDFALLLRRFLEKSDSSFLTIEEELEIIDLYLAIQQRRYNNAFGYSIECPPELSKRNIPSMLIQPFVENSIIHGVAHSDQTCFLSVSVRQEDEFIEIRIKDNGIGRVRSREINKNRKNHISYGIQLVNEKIDVIFQKYGIKIDLSIEDVEETAGTLVVLKIPMNDKVFDS